MQVSILEAAQRLSVSPDTVRRRVRGGLLAAHQEGRGKGYRWLVDLPEHVSGGRRPLDLEVDHSIEGEAEQVRHLEELVVELRGALTMARDELEARRGEVQQLLALLRTAQPV